MSYIGILAISYCGRMFGLDSLLHDKVDVSSTCVLWKYRHQIIYSQVHPEPEWELTVSGKQTRVQVFKLKRAPGESFAVSRWELY